MRNRQKIHLVSFLILYPSCSVSRWSNRVERFACGYAVGELQFASEEASDGAVRLILYPLQNMAQTSSISSSVVAIAKNLGTLALLLLLLPFNLAMILVSIISNVFDSKKQTVTSKPVEKKRILITGAKMTKAFAVSQVFLSRRTRRIFS